MTVSEFRILNLKFENVPKDVKLRQKLIESSFTGSTGVMGGKIATMALMKRIVKIGRRQPRLRQQHVSFQRNLQWLIQKSIIRKVRGNFSLDQKEGFPYLGRPL